MISTNETADYEYRRYVFKKAVKNECKEDGSINCLLTVINTISELASEDASNIYNHEALNDLHLERMLELHDAMSKTHALNHELKAWKEKEE